MLLFAIALLGASFWGEVIEVFDGDTIRIKDILSSRGGEVTVDLQEIDAPELDSKQPFAEESKRALSQKLLGKIVEVESSWSEPRGHMIATVYLRKRGQKENVNAWMLKEGWAWQKRYFWTDEFAAIEESARKQHVGLWAGNEKPIPPWEWRKATANNPKKSGKR